MNSKYVFLIFFLFVSCAASNDFRVLYENKEIEKIPTMLNPLQWNLELNLKKLKKTFKSDRIEEGINEEIYIDEKKIKNSKYYKIYTDFKFIKSKGYIEICHYNYKKILSVSYNFGLEKNKKSYAYTSRKFNKLKKMLNKIYGKPHRTDRIYDYGLDERSKVFIWIREGFQIKLSISGIEKEWEYGVDIERDLIKK